MFSVLLATFSDAHEVTMSNCSPLAEVGALPHFAGVHHSVRAPFPEVAVLLAVLHGAHGPCAPRGDVKVLPAITMLTELPWSNTLAWLRLEPFLMATIVPTSSYSLQAPSMPMLKTSPTFLLAAPNWRQCTSWRRPINRVQPFQSEFSKKKVLRIRVQWKRELFETEFTFSKQSSALWNRVQWTINWE